MKHCDDESSFGWAFLGFLIPVVGLILYLVWKQDYPLKAKSAGKGALVGVIAGVVLMIIYGGLVVSVMSSIY